MSAQSLLRPLVRRRVLLALLLLVVVNPPAAHAGDASGVARARTQSVSLQVLPAIHQDGATPASSTRASAVVTASLSPAQPGRVVSLERRNEQGWKPKASSLTDAAGRAEFVVPSPRGGPASYRVVAEAYRGWSPTTSDVAATDTWGVADFVDEFDGDTLGPAWEHRIQFYNPWGGRACSKGSPDAVGVADGTLQLGSIPDPAATTACPATDLSGVALGDFPYRLNGHVSTQHSMDFLYGVAAARMRFQRDPGAHAAFWLQPRGLLETGPTPWGAEVDVVEWYGVRGGRSRMTSTVHAPLPNGDKLHFGGAVRRPDRFLASQSDAWWRSFHVFSVEWTPTEYVFRIDGHEVWRTHEGVSHDPEFLILSMLSSDFELPNLGARQGAAQTASVDWVKVWKADPVVSP